MVEKSLFLLDRLKDVIGEWKIVAPAPIPMVGDVLA